MIVGSEMMFPYGNEGAKYGFGFAGSPIVLTFQTSSADYAKGGVAPRLVVDVETNQSGVGGIGKVTTRYEQEFVAGDKVRVDISSHFEKAFARRWKEVGPEIWDVMALDCTVKVWSEAMVDGTLKTMALINTGGATANPFGGTIYAIVGSLSEGVRLARGWNKPQDVLDGLQSVNGENGVGLLLSLKPLGDEVMPEGSKIRKNYLWINSRRTTPVEETPLVVDDNPYRVVMRFVNSFGVVESVSVLLGAEKYDNESESYSMMGEPSFAPSMASVANKSTSSKGKLSMSSGFVSRAWARWFATEFLPQPGRMSRYWLKGKNGWLPVTIKGSTSTIFDRDKAGMCSVTFEVTPGVSGVVDIL